MQSESLRYVGRAVVALAADPKANAKSGRVFSSLGTGTGVPIYGPRRHPAALGQLCDERFYSYWVPGLVELIFPDWF